jgi:UDP:flavonoid glycosyltransferase YjiC (YdhE family)
MSGGGVSLGIRSNPAGGLWVYEWLPQLQVLPRTAVFFTHGGINSLTEAHYFGVPVVVMPVVNDAFGNANWVERAGVGVQLDLDTFTVESAVAALDAGFAQDSPLRARVRKVRDSYVAANGAQRSLQAIERVIASKTH